MFVNRDGSGGHPSVGDRVGVLLDTSQNATTPAGPGVHLYADTDAARPTLQQTAGGLYYLDFTPTQRLIAATPGFGIRDLAVFMAMSSTFPVTNYMGVLSFGGAAGDDYNRLDALVADTGGTGESLAWFSGPATDHVAILGAPANNTTDLGVWELIRGSGVSTARYDGLYPATDSSYTEPAETHAGPLIVNGRFYAGAIAADQGTNLQMYRLILATKVAATVAQGNALRQAAGASSGRTVSDL